MRCYFYYLGSFEWLLSSNIRGFVLHLCLGYCGSSRHFHCFQVSAHSNIKKLLITKNQSRSLNVWLTISPYCFYGQLSNLYPKSRDAFCLWKCFVFTVWYFYMGKEKVNVNKHRVNCTLMACSIIILHSTGLAYKNERFTG